jgi:hypothetical protein
MQGLNDYNSIRPIGNELVKEETKNNGDNYGK